MSQIHTIKGEIKDTIAIGIPLVSSQLIFAANGFISTAMVAKLGVDALAASALVSTIWVTMISFISGLLNSISILVSHQYGAKNYSAIAEIMEQAYWLGLFSSVLMLFLLYLATIFISFTVQSQQVLSIARLFLFSLEWGIPGLLLTCILEQFLLGANKVKIVLIVSFIVTILQTLTAYILIFGKFGFPALGVSALGYSFAIVYSITGIFLFYYLLRSKEFDSIKIFNSINLNTAYFKELIRIGLPMGLLEIIEVSTFMVMTFFIARFGTTFLAANQIALQYLSLVLTVNFAMSQVVSIRVGHDVGRNDRSGIIYATYTAMGINFFCISLFALAFYFSPVSFIKLDININDARNALLIQESSALLAINAVLILCNSFRLIAFGALRALKDTRFSMYVALIGFWFISFAAAYILGFMFSLGGIGIWWGLTLGEVFCAIMSLGRLFYMLKRLD